MGKSKYSLGFQSQENENTSRDLVVEGNIPEWLSGSLMRTAPSKFEVGENNYRHWFDGLAMLHKFSFEHQKVTYASKFLQSEAYQEAINQGRIVYGEFGTDPCRDLFQKVVSFFQGPRATDNGCVNINQYGEELTATTETPKPIRFHLGNLETAGRLNFEDELKGQVTIVHPHYDKEGTMYSYLTKFGYKSYYNVYTLSPKSNSRKLIASVPTDEPAYMHSIGMTENYIILTEFPVVANSLRFRFSNKPFIDNYTWKPEKGTTIHAIEKSTGKISTYHTDPFFAFHHVNAFEQDDEVVFDIVAYQNADIINQLYLDRLRADQPTASAGQLWRFTIQPNKGLISRKIIANTPIELPRTNYTKVNTAPYKYVYGVGNSITGNFLDNITKIAVTSGEATIWHKADLYPGEPIFVEKPEAKSEDDGILLSVVLDTTQKKSFLLILNAKNLEEIARAYVPHHITFGFHGQYVPV